MTRNYRYKSTPSIHDPRLTPYDILCGRTSHAYNNVGNRRFRVTIRMFLQRYQMLHSRADRKVFIFYLTKLCREEIGFRFLKEESGDFHDIGEVETRKKIGHALLDQTAKEAPQVASGSTSPPVLMRKITDDKKAIKSILKTSPRQTIQPTLQCTPADPIVRRVSLPPPEPKSALQKSTPSRGSKYFSMEKTKLSTIQTKDSVTNLESEVCMLLVGLHKQTHRPNPQECVA